MFCSFYPSKISVKFLLLKLTYNFNHWKRFFFFDKQVLKWKFMQFYKIKRRRPKKKKNPTKNWTQHFCKPLINEGFFPEFFPWIKSVFWQTITGIINHSQFFFLYCTPRLFIKYTKCRLTNIFKTDTHSFGENVQCLLRLTLTQK